MAEVEAYWVVKNEGEEACWVVMDEGEEVYDNVPYIVIWQQILAYRDDHDLEVPEYIDYFYNSSVIDQVYDEIYEQVHMLLGLDNNHDVHQVYVVLTYIDL